MFFLVKIFSGIFSILMIFFLICVLALIFATFRRRIMAGFVLGIAIASLLFFSSDFGQNTLAFPLESSIPVVNPLDHPNIKTVIVLGGGRYDDSDRPANSTLSIISVSRLVEGIRVFNLINADNLVFTGKDFISGGSIAMLMKQCAIDLGVEKSKIATIDNARNTREEANHCAEFFSGDTVFLVSSATHLKRATEIFNDEGIFVFPMPADYQIHKKDKKTLLDIFPNSSRLVDSDKSIHEYLGLLWEKVK
jgi:uncharacterized SAM-binding protein YcdF (DUF218 family)